MFYKYEVSYWFDGVLCDGCGIVFGRSMPEAVEYLSDWYGKTEISNLAIDAIELDISVPVLPLDYQVDLLGQVVEAVEQ